MTGLESIGIHRTASPPTAATPTCRPIYTGRETSRRLIQPNWDCKPSGGPVEAKPAPAGATVACFTQPNQIFKGKRQGRFPHVEREDYRRRGR